MRQLLLSLHTAQSCVQPVDSGRMLCVACTLYAFLYAMLPHCRLTAVQVLMTSSLTSRHWIRTKHWQLQGAAVADRDRTRQGAKARYVACSTAPADMAPCKPLLVSCMAEPCTADMCYPALATSMTCTAKHGASHSAKCRAWQSHALACVMHGRVMHRRLCHLTPATRRLLPA